MVKLLRRLVLWFIWALRREPLTRWPLLRLLNWLHNWSYHLLSFFSSHTGIHPKHDIMRYHEFFIANVSSSDAVLDVGAGNGKVAFEVAQHASSVVGIDIRPANVAKAEAAYQRPNLRYLLGDATTHTFASSFDVVMLSNVLEHIDDRVGLLRSLKQLAPKILIRVPAITRDWLTVYKQQHGLEYRLDDTHTIEYDEETLRDEIATAGLNVTSLATRFGEFYAVCQRQATK